jgi:putative tryptophan/tyrosine transport system substrate-binding protein
MRSRTAVLLLALLLGLVAHLAPADAQPPANVPRVGFFRPAPPSPEVARILEAFKQGLREQGYVDGQNVAVEVRFPTTTADRLSDIATELVRLKPIAIFAAASSGIDAVRNATTTIPIVALDLETDPLASGIVASLDHPGGNITGIFLDFPELGGKWLELVKEVAPKVSRVAVLWDPATGRVPLKGAEAAAPSLRLQLQVLEARGPDEFEAVFRSAIRARAGAVVTLSSPVFNTYRRLLVDLAAKHRLPAIMPFPFFADDGGLIAYGPDLIELYRQGGVMVGKILKGAKAKDLPVERPNRFVLVVNKKTAKALGITVPHSVLIRADRLIE